jgi:hypothetical protein
MLTMYAKNELANFTAAQVKQLAKPPISLWSLKEALRDVGM